MYVAENKQEYLDDFIRLNEEWIASFFEIEDADRKLAANPNKVIDDGGYIFSLIFDEEVVGVCALFNEGNGVYELARMAVFSKHHGKGYGKKLMQECISKLKEIEAKKVYLISNTKLKIAISLYEKYGFQTVSKGQHPNYLRANIVMERNVS